MQFLKKKMPLLNVTLKLPENEGEDKSFEKILNEVEIDSIPTKFINEVHQTAWRLGIKTLYYLRTDSVINGDIGSRTSTDCLSCDG